MSHSSCRGRGANWISGAAGRTLVGQLTNALQPRFAPIEPAPRTRPRGKRRGYRRGQK